MFLVWIKWVFIVISLSHRSSIPFELENLSHTVQLFCVWPSPQIVVTCSLALQTDPGPLGWNLSL